MALKVFDFEDCVREGLLRRVPPSPNNADYSMTTACKWLKEAEKDFESGAFNSSILASYLAMFHAARALLFFDGFREKSHYCIARYLDEKYAKSGALEKRWIELLDHYREMRHSSQYDINFFTNRQEAENALKNAKKFTDEMKILLEKRRRNSN